MTAHEIITNLLSHTKAAVNLYEERCSYRKAERAKKDAVDAEDWLVRYKHDLGFEREILGSFFLDPRSQVSKAIRNDTEGRRQITIVSEAAEFDEPVKDRLIRELAKVATRYIEGGEHCICFAWDGECPVCHANRVLSTAEGEGLA